MATAAPFPFLHPPRQADELGWLGGYRLLAILGQGGMGFVFRAEDVRLNRQVALKVIRPEAADLPTGRQRFLREAQALAAVQHDHIVAVHQVGEDNGVPFLVMPLLLGESLERRLEREGKLPVAEAVRVGREMAEGLAAAHAAGIIHRDVKPSNVWLEGEPGASATGGRVKLLDFGLAWAAQAENKKLTRSGAVLGTPSYLAPEQIEGRVDTRSDLFSLGCVLYEMLTGRRAFDGDHVLAILACLASVTPPAPATLEPSVPAALSELVLALLNKRPEERPATAQAVVRDLLALDGPSGACVIGPPPSQTLAATKAGERPRVSDSGPTLADVAGATVRGGRRWPRRIAATVLLLAITTPLFFGVLPRWIKQLGPDRRPTDLRTEPQSNEEQQRTRTEAGGPVVREKATLKGHTGIVPSVCFSPDGKTLASAGGKEGEPGEIKLWDAQSGQERTSLKGHKNVGMLVCFSPDGKTLASAGWGGMVKLWDAQSGQERTSLKRLELLGTAWSMVFSPDGTVLAIANGDVPTEPIELWDGRSGQKRAVLSNHTRGVRAAFAVCFSPDGKTLASAGHRAILLLDAQSGQVRATLDGHTDVVGGSVAFGPDGKTLASGGGGHDAQGKPLPGEIKLWDSVTGQERASLKGHTGFVNSVAFSPDGKTLASASVDHTIKLWDIETGQERATLKGHTNSVRCVVFSPDGKTLASASNDGTIKLWEDVSSPPR
jgi:WD40 repeat protein/tRNA A-37 threonylcarbamoyl transferase component Bud32